MQSKDITHLIILLIQMKTGTITKGRIGSHLGSYIGFLTIATKPFPNGELSMATQMCLQMYCGQSESNNRYSWLG